MAIFSQQEDVSRCTSEEKNSLSLLWYYLIFFAALFCGFIVDTLLHQGFSGLLFFILNFFIVVISLYCALNTTKKNPSYTLHFWQILFLVLSLLISVWIFIRASHWLLGFDIFITIVLTALFFVNVYRGPLRNADIGFLIPFKFIAFSFDKALYPFRKIIGSFIHLPSQPYNIESKFIKRFLLALILSAPVVLFIGILLISSDLILRSYLTQAIEWFFSFSFWNFFYKILTHSWIIAYVIFFSGLFYSLFRKKGENKLRPFGSSVSEQFIFLVMGIIVALLLAVFILVQIRYLFGDSEVVAQMGITYAQYARRGFYELMVVSVITFSISWILGSRQDIGGDASLKERLVSLILVSETVFLLVSALKRIMLYIDVFNWTEKRFFAYEGMIFFIGLIILFIAHLFIKRFDRKKYAYVAVMLLACNVIFLNIMNPDAYIAKANVSAYTTQNIQEFEFDFDYTSYISADSVSYGIELFDKAKTDQERFRAAQGLISAWYEISADKKKIDSSWLSYHWSKNRAYMLLEARQQEFTQYYTNNEKKYEGTPYDLVPLEYYP